MLKSGPDRQPSKVASAETYREVASVLNALFEPKDLVEIRAVDKSEATPRVIRRRFLTTEAILDRLHLVERVNQDGNEVFFGVCPRGRHSGSKDAVSKVRCIWADFDNVPESEAHWRWNGKLPEPSLLVASSNRGTHAYWRLEEPIDVSTTKQRTDFETMLQSLFESIGADSCWDVSRLLRLPGLNWKSFHQQGRPPERCRIVWQSDTVYSEEIFRPWFEQARQVRRPTFPLERQPSINTEQRIDDLVSSLDCSTNDRSKRDFRVICELLRLGVTDESILWHLVGEKSKFQGRQRYFETTLRNALRHLKTSS